MNLQVDIVWQDYDFDYSDDGEDPNDSGSADVENQYYTAKCMNCCRFISKVIDALLSNEGGQSGRSSKSFQINC